MALKGLNMIRSPGAVAERYGRTGFQRLGRDSCGRRERFWDLGNPLGCGR